MNPVRRMLAALGVAVMKQSTLVALNRKLSSPSTFLSEVDLAFLRAMPTEKIKDLLSYLPRSVAQLRQDLLALVVHDFKRNGYFVEFGAADGVTLSNTLLLETQFSWGGVLAEPCKQWHSRLYRSRKCAIDDRCVWSESGSRIRFREAKIRELSTVDVFAASDGHATLRAEGDVYDVETVSLGDLLLAHNAPEYIDYLSIDTEGSEYEILKSFDFSKHRFGLITCEHNHGDSREAIESLLRAEGYLRFLEPISRWDDWYLDSENSELISRFK